MQGPLFGIDLLISNDVIPDMPRKDSLAVYPTTVPWAEFLMRRNARTKTTTKEGLERAKNGLISPLLGSHFDLIVSGCNCIKTCQRLISRMHFALKQRCLWSMQKNTVK